MGGKRPNTIVGITTVCLCLLTVPGRASGENETDPPRPPSDQSAARDAHSIYSEELHRFAVLSQSFPAMTAAFVRRDSARERARLLAEHRRASAAERRDLAAIRDQTMRELEGFLTRHPNDQRLTPDIMLRLAELAHDRALAARIDEPDGGTERESYSRSIELTRGIVARYPNFPNIDRVLFLLGLSLHESGSTAEARRAWLHLVCHNRFQYRSTVDEPDESPGSVSPSRRSRHGRRPRGNSYASCTPVAENSRFVTDAWLRIGAHHFDNVELDGADALAVAAFRNAARDEENRYHDIALYYLAWSLFRVDRPAEAIAGFVALLDHLETQEPDADQPEGAIRPFAIRFIAICFAQDDWDNDARPDSVRGIDRLQDENLLPQDRGYTAEVYFETADFYFELARYAESAELFELSLERWPLNLQGPRAVNQITEAYNRSREFDSALRAQLRMVAYAPGSQWQRTNAGAHPEIAARASRRARNALFDSAIRHHQIAQQHRRRVIEEESTEHIQRARDEYAAAVEGYRNYLELFPHDPDAYELHFNMAEAHYFSGRFREAAEEYTWVRDSVLDSRFRLSGAFRAIRALENVRDDMVQEGTLQPREPPPTPTGIPPRVNELPMPEILRTLNAARDAYLRLDPDSSRALTFRFQSAQLLHRYGYWNDARERFNITYSAGCGEGEPGFRSLEYLVSMADALGDRAEVRRLAEDQRARGCTRPPDETTADGGSHAP